MLRCINELKILLLFKTGLTREEARELLQKCIEEVNLLNLVITANFLV